MNNFKNTILVVNSIKKSDGTPFKGILARKYRNCLDKSVLYGKCMKENLKTINRDVCKNEMIILMECIKLS
jgi:hypothetical protein